MDETLRIAAANAEAALGYGWWLGVTEDDRELYFDPMEWFAMAWLTAPSLWVESVVEFKELQHLPAWRAWMPLVRERTSLAHPLQARAAIRSRGGSNFELVIGPNERDDPEVIGFARTRDRVGVYRPAPI